MKKLLNLITLLVVLAGCHHGKSKPPKIDWTVYRIAYDWLARQPDSAFYYFNQVAANSRDSMQTAMAYNNMSKIQYRAGDYYGAQESSVASLRYLDEQRKSDYAMLASNYNDLGLVRSELRDHDGAIAFYRQSLRFTADPALTGLAWNNIAFAYQQKKDYPHALAIYRELLAKTDPASAAYARVLTNFATARWLDDPGFNAASGLLTGLDIRKRLNDLWGENSSYSHLADYYQLRRPDSALLYARQMYDIAQQIESPDDQLKALGKLIVTGPASSLKSYFVRYRQLNDSIQTARNAAKNQFALIRYNVEKSRADNLRLQKENADKRYQIIRQRLLLYSLLAAVAVLSLLGWNWYRKRKQRIELAAEQRIRDNQLMTSKRVHDIVANGLYQMMTEIENQDLMDRNELLDKVEQMYERSRDISYEKQSPRPDFAAQIGSLLTSFASSGRRIAIAGNSDQLWAGVSDGVRYELEQVLRELMVNMVKHSGARDVTVRFSRARNRISVLYHDDGTGLQEGATFKNGLTSTGNRIHTISGTITFDSDGTGGLTVRMEIPVG